MNWNWMFANQRYADPPPPPPSPLCFDPISMEDAKFADSNGKSKEKFNRMKSVIFGAPFTRL